MTVVFKTLSGQDLLTSLGMQEVHQKLAKAGIKVAVTPKAIKLVVDGEVVGSVGWDAADVKAVVAGTAAGPLIAEMSASVFEAAGKALQLAGAKPASPGGKPVTNDGTEAAPAAYPVFDVTKLAGAPLVKLRDASKLYQPVSGSSQSSRYFMVASGPGLKVAARYSGPGPNPGLSIRVEGAQFETFIDNLALCGFTNIHGKKGYASLHLKIEDPVLASKALGAMLLGLGIPFETPLPDLKVIQGKGAGSC